MTIAKTVVDYLQKNHVAYAVLPHPHTDTSRQSADQSHILGDSLAKAVVLRDGRNYLMAVVPANRHVHLETLSAKLGRDLHLADEDRLVPVFKDCAPGAIPALGPAYGMETILDDSLVGQPEVYFEAGDHEELIQVQGDEFLKLLKEARHGQFSH
jgi:Ala-tRNA(Pro) deacylase